MTLEKNKSFANRTFEIPTANNSITDNDVLRNQIRVTIELKEYFPKSSTQIEIEFQNQKYFVKFVHKGNRSHVINLKRNLAELIKLKEGTKFRMTKTGELSYKIG